MKRPVEHLTAAELAVLLGALNAAPSSTPASKEYDARLASKIRRIIAATEGK